MLVSKRSMISGHMSTRDIPITEERFAEYMRIGHLVKIQEFFPDLSADDREFLLTGTTPEEWDDTFGEDE